MMMMRPHRSRSSTQKRMGIRHIMTDNTKQCSQEHSLPIGTINSADASKRALRAPRRAETLKAIGPKGKEGLAKMHGQKQGQAQEHPRMVQ